MNVVIVEGSITIRAQLQALLARERRIQVVGEAACEASAIETITRTQPDVVVMDLALQPGSGLRVLRAIRQLGIGARAIVLGCTEIPLVLDAAAAGAPVIDATAALARQAVAWALAPRHK
ncbi:response regulator [Mitsuaria sp. TWR114]|uniref:response regulator n=1 Tax=Mitsuaria sp. TWR114 TaxID=2601731 RepID=UPI00164C3A52|nr:response regulator [Mitsuaria sp. TWR114]